MKTTMNKTNGITKKILTLVCAVTTVLMLGTILVSCGNKAPVVNEIVPAANEMLPIANDDGLEEMEEDMFIEQLMEIHENNEVVETEEEEYNFIECSFDGEVLRIFGEGPMDDFIQTATYCPWEDYIYDAKTIIIEEGVTNIGARAFSHASSLEEVIIPDSVTEIGRFAFQYCSALKSITIPDSVTSVGESAFYACGSLSEVKLSASMSAIEEDMFSYTYALKTITIPGNIKVICREAFSYSGLEEVVICDGVEKIDYYAFKNSSLKEVKIPGSVTEIDGWAFFDCFDLETIVVDNEEGTFDLYMMNTKRHNVVFTK